MEVKLTTWEVLRNKFPAEEYVLLTEVSDASGFSRSRSLDYMLVNLWQSRGLAVTGIEKKSNRGDWLKELKNPAKQENHFKHCDYFYLLTDKEGVAKIEEIPETWGWYHINDKQILKTMKAAPKLSSTPIDRSFLCAMLRRAASKEKYVHVDTLESVIRERSESLAKQLQNNNDRKVAEYDSLIKKVQDFEQASGISIQYGWEMKNVGEAVKLILGGGLEKHIQTLEWAERRIKSVHDDVLNNIKNLKKCPIELQNVQVSDTTEG